jgi:hypothetical protein
MAMEIFKLIGSVFVDTDAANKSLHKTDQNAESFGKTLLNGIGTAAKWAAGVAAAAGTAASALAVSAVKSYADYEQLTGGIVTMFEDLSVDVEQYANNAYRTAGLSANAYMETVMGFSAALTASLKASEGDISRAADLADQTVIDMADNAAKFGTDMTAIQNAYSGFAKQNYTMLDNLKLGYGGTKTEMERLLADAQELTGVEYNIDNLADVYEAIHAIQTEMGITGTVAAEGTGTISGGIGLIKAQLENFKTTIGSALAPVVQGFISSVIDKLPTIEGWVEQLTPMLTDMLSGILAVLPDFVQGLMDIILGFQDAVTWGKEHQTLLGLIAIAVGTLTVAIGLYQAAEALKNIAVTAGVAAQGSATVAMGLHTVATNVATAASSAFGAVMAFITSPITLVVVAIGALIAIIVLLVKNWDTVKEFAIKCWEGIKNAWSKVASWFSTNVTKPIADFFSGLWTGIKTTFSNVGSWFTNIFTSAVNGVKNAWSGIKNWFSTLLNGVKSVFTSIGTAIGGIFKSPINTIIRGINSFIRGLNKIKIPNWVPAVGGKGFNISTIPLLERGGVLEKGQTGFLEGNGAEAVVPLDKNKKWVSAVARDMDSAIGGASGGQVVAVLMDILEVLEAMAATGNNLDSAAMIRALVSLLAKPMDKKLGQLQAAKARA